MNKKTKKKLYTLLFVAIVLCFTYFFNKDLFNELKNSVYEEIFEIPTEKVKDKDKDKNKDKDEPTISSTSIEKIDEVDKIELTDDLTIFYLDVGQADSTLIKSQDKYMLIDAGNNKDGRKLVDYFKKLGIESFEYVVGTHAHEDHIGGMDDVIENFKIKNFYMPDDITTTKTFEDVLDSLEKNNVTFKTPEIGTKLKLGESNIEILYVAKDKEDLNDDSIVLKLTYKNTSFLFTGDATNNVEKEILDSNLESTILKVGHHGSKYSSSANFLTKVRPKYAIISCGKKNDYGHPHDITVQKLEKLNSKIYRTDELGTIVAISDGDNITFKNIKTDTNGE